MKSIIVKSLPQHCLSSVTVEIHTVCQAKNTFCYKRILALHYELLYCKRKSTFVTNFSQILNLKYWEDKGQQILIGRKFWNVLSKFVCSIFATLEWFFQYFCPLPLLLRRRQCDFLSRSLPLVFPQFVLRLSEEEGRTLTYWSLYHVTWVMNV